MLLLHLIASILKQKIHICDQNHLHGCADALSLLAA